MHEGVEVFLPLLIAINSVLLEEGCKIGLEIKLVTPSWEAGYLSFDLLALHSAAPSKSVLKRARVVWAIAGGTIATQRQYV
jgi:hypothetical protein